MKLLLEQWREFVKQEVEEFLPHGEVRAVKKIGSSTLSPKEQAEQDLEKYGYVRDEDERDFDIEVQIAGVSNEDVEEWAFSEEAEELESSYNYDVQLRIVENWRKYLSESTEGFTYLSASPWSATDAKHEWGEEVNTTLKEGDDYIGQRWPGLNKEIIEKKYPYLLSAEGFAKALSSAPIENLSLSQMKNIHNHAQVYDIIEMYKNDKTPEQVHDEMYEFFKGHTTDPDASGKTYAKESSYQRWVDMFKESDSIDKPSVVIKLPDGGIAHVSGQTRQTGALTNQKIVPYAVLTSIKGESDETPT